jgi:hypothetical protein
MYHVLQNQCHVMAHKCKAWFLEWVLIEFIVLLSSYCGTWLSERKHAY